KKKEKKKRKKNPDSQLSSERRSVIMSERITERKKWWWLISLVGVRCVAIRSKTRQNEAYTAFLIKCTLKSSHGKRTRHVYGFVSSSDGPVFLAAPRSKNARRIVFQIGKLDLSDEERSLLDRVWISTEAGTK